MNPIAESLGRDEPVLSMPQSAAQPECVESPEVSVESPNTIEAFTRHAIAGERRQALAIARESLARGGLAQVYEGLMRPAMDRVGELWCDNAITVADEHVATATAQSIVALLYAEVAWPPPGPKAVVLCVESERHQFGARMVADLLALDGWDALFVGADVPISAAITLLRRTSPVLLAVSVTLTSNVEAAQRLVCEARGAFPAMKILVGGRALETGTSMEWIGADAVAPSARRAVEVARWWKS